MSHLKQTIKWGYKIRLRADGNLSVSPWSKCKQEHRDYIRNNKKQIIEELKGHDREGRLGTIIAEIIKRTVPSRLLEGLPVEGCQCKDYEAKLNKWGLEESIKRKDQVLEHFASQMLYLGIAFKVMPKILRLKLASRLFEMGVKKERRRLDGQKKV